MLKKIPKAGIIFSITAFVLVLVELSVPYLIWERDLAMALSLISVGLTLALVGIVGYNIRRLVSIDTTAKNLPGLTGMIIYNSFFGLSFVLKGITSLTHQSSDIQFLAATVPMCLGIFAGAGAYLIKRREITPLKAMHRSELFAIAGINLLGFGILVQSLTFNISLELIGSYSCILCPVMFIPAAICLLLAGIFRLNEKPHTP